MSGKITSTNIKSHELITDELVKKALSNDRGISVELLSYEIKDFTSKGDGYMSVVTSITVQYKENEKQSQKSYVAKLNPLRPQSSLSDFTEQAFNHEKTILLDVIGDMNKHLEMLKLPHIKTPRLYANSLVKGKESLITENLKTQGFVLHDRMKGQDVNHALLVVEELGRFHASSLLVEETITPKTFKETYEFFQENLFDINSSAFQTFGAMFTSQAEGAIEYLKSIPKYEKCMKWLETNKTILGEYFFNSCTSSDSFDVLVHGDSWTNNILFKYDEKNIPIDMRFVDLQCSRKASPATDLLYFVYSSLNGDIRSKHFEELLLAYYQSFSKVLALAQRSVPFKFKEFQEEVENNKIYGLVTGILMVQGVLFVKDDEIMDFNKLTDDKLDDFTEEQSKNYQKNAEREGPFKDRFLSLFDEMLQILDLED